MSWLDSSNPAFTDDMFDTQYGGVMTKPDVTTMNGVVHKTLVLTAIAIGAGCIGYGVSQQFPGVVMISCLLGFVVTLGVFFALRSKPGRAKYLGPVYAVVEGFFLGAFTSMLDGILQTQGIVTLPLALQAFVITGSLFGAMLGLYRLGWLRPTKTFTAVLSVATVGIMITYLISFGMALFGFEMPFISLGSAFQGGTPALIGLGVNVLILFIAALWFVVDFGVIENSVKSGAPADMEWYCGFALLTSLAWVYFEAVKVAFRVAMLVGNRD